MMNLTKLDQNKVNNRSSILLNQIKPTIKNLKNNLTFHKTSSDSILLDKVFF